MQSLLGPTHKMNGKYNEQQILLNEQAREISFSHILSNSRGLHSVIRQRAEILICD